MSYIYTVSPDYLDTVYSECKVYRYIDIIGYRDIEKAYKRFHFTNVKDVLGYMYIGDDLPSFESMMKFIRKIELTLNKSKMLMLVVRNRDSYEEFLSRYRGSLVTIRAIAGFEVLTDVILKNAIGTIYKTQAEPYLELANNSSQDLFVSDKYISFERLAPKPLTMLIQPVNKLGDLESTVKFDDVLSKIRVKDSFNYLYRLAFIKSCFTKDVVMPKDSPYDLLTTQSLKHILKEGDLNEKTF